MRRSTPCTLLRARKQGTRGCVRRLAWNATRSRFHARNAARSGAVRAWGAPGPGRGQRRGRTVRPGPATRAWSRPRRRPPPPRSSSPAARARAARFSSCSSDSLEPDDERVRRRRAFGLAAGLAGVAHRRSTAASRASSRGLDLARHPPGLLPLRVDVGEPRARALEVALRRRAPRPRRSAPRGRLVGRCLRVLLAERAAAGGEERVLRGPEPRPQLRPRPRSPPGRPPSTRAISSLNRLAVAATRSSRPATRPRPSAPPCGPGRRALLVQRGEVAATPALVNVSPRRGDPLPQLARRPSRLRRRRIAFHSSTMARNRSPVAFHSASSGTAPRPPRRARGRCPPGRAARAARGLRLGLLRLRLAPASAIRGRSTPRSPTTAASPSDALQPVAAKAGLAGRRLRRRACSPAGRPRWPGPRTGGRSAPARPRGLPACHEPTARSPSAVRTYTVPSSATRPHSRVVTAHTVPAGSPVVLSRRRLLPATAAARPGARRRRGGRARRPAGGLPGRRCAALAAVRRSS